MDRSIARAPFALKPVVAAVALAASAAWAAPTPNQMPGAGQFVAGSLASTVQVNGGAPLPLNTTITGLVNGARIDVFGKIVLHWGVGGLLDPGNPHGFNLGSNATLYFGGGNAGNAPPAVLNVDVSGNPSQIYGNLISTAAPWIGCLACIDAPVIFLANANGIVVGPGGRIVAPTGVGLIGADMSNATSRNEFIGNNGWVAPAAPAYGNSYLSFGTVPSTGNVTIAGAINGDLMMNKPAQYVLVAGNDVDVLNTGNLFGRIVTLDAGVVAQTTAVPVGGVAGVSVNRIWRVDAGTEAACCVVGTGLGQLNLVPGITGNVINEGSISTQGTSPGEWIEIQAKGNVRSGVAGSTDGQVGLFSDRGVYIDSYGDANAVELYNVVSGYTTNKSLPFLFVNVFAEASGFHPDVTIQAITPGGQPSSITTTGIVEIHGGNIDIRSTINRVPNAVGGVQNDVDLVISGTRSVTISAGVGAGASSRITSYGPLTISDFVVSDANADGNGGIYVSNNGANAPTTISGSLVVLPSSTSSLVVNTDGPLTISGSVISLGSLVDIHNNGTGPGNFTDISGDVGAIDSIHILNSLSPADKPLTISGLVVAVNDVSIENFGAAAGNATTISGDVRSNTGDVFVNHVGPPTGRLTMSGSLTAANDINVFSSGHAQIGTVNAGDAILAEVLGTSLLIDGPWTAGSAIGVESPLAQTRLNPFGILTAPSVNLAGLSFTGVNALGVAYADAGEKPAAQIVTNDLNVILLGSINAPLAPPPPPDAGRVGPAATPTNWLANSLDIAPLATLAPVFVSVTANGSGFQAVNLRVLGDAIVDSGATATPFIGVPLTTGGLPAGGIQGNLGSQLILQADGYLQVWGTPTLSLFGPLLAFQWPGGAVFRAGTTLQTFAPIYNAYTTASPPYGGLFFEAPYIALGGYVATSGTAWANFSTQPVTGDPTVYQIRKVGPTSFGYEATTAFVKNAYSNSVTGGYVCSQTGPTTWVVCP